MYSFLTRSNQSLQGMLSVVTFGSADPKTSCCHTLTLTLASLPCGSLFSKAVSGNAYRWLALRVLQKSSRLLKASEQLSQAVCRQYLPAWARSPHPEWHR